MTNAVRKTQKSRTLAVIQSKGVGAYVRLSQDRKKDGTKVENQLDEITAKAERDGVTIDRIYTDNDISAVSGKHRPDYDRLLTDIQNGDIGIVYVWHTDRLIRRTKDIDPLTVLAKAVGGIDIRQVTGPPMDLLSPAGIMQLQMATSVSEFEGRHKAERAELSYWRAVDDGKAPASRIFGYDRETVIRSEAAIVREVFEWIAAGESIRGAVRRLSEAGIVNQRGDAWQRFTVRTMLRNPRYIGERAYSLGGTDFQIIGDKPGNWEPIIDRPLFQQVQNILTRPERKTVNDNTRKFLGPGFYTCGGCGWNMTTKYIGCHRPDETGYRKPRRGYTCNKCRLSRSYADQIDDLVTAQIVDYLASDEFRAAMAAKSEGGRFAECAREHSELEIESGLIVSELSQMPLTDRVNRAGVTARARVVSERMAQLEADMAHLREMTALAKLSSATDPARAWLAESISTRQQIAKDAGIAVIVQRVNSAPRAPWSRKPIVNGESRPEAIKIDSLSVLVQFPTPNG